VLLTDFLALFPTVVEERDGWLVECPGHADSKPSLRVAVSDAGKVLVRCRAGCETRAVLDAMGLSFGDLAGMDVSGADVVRASSTDTPAGPAEVAALRARLDGWAAELDLPPGHGHAALDYAAARFGLTADDVRRLGLGYAGDLGGGWRLVVPFRDKQLVARGFQARALDKSAAVRWLGPKSPDGASWARIGWFDGSADWPEVIICEGPGDALTACAVGYDTIGVRGAGLASNASVVADIAAWLDGRVGVIAGDGDPAGRAFSSTLSKALLEAGARAKILDVPDGLDLTDWRAQDPGKFSADFVRAIVQASEQTSTSSALRSRDESAYPLTDLGNARFARDFIASQGSGVRYSPEAGFFLLSGGVWRLDRLDRARAYVQEAADLVAEVADTLAANATTPQELKDAQRWRGWARHSQSSRGIDAALRELQALRDVAADMADFDRHPDLLACRNGVVNLRTGLLRPHDPALLLTRLVDIDYDPGAQCPRWERFLDEVFPNHPGLPGFVQRLVGYGITGSTAEQCFAVLWGTGANGKSVFTDTLTEVFREVTVTTPFSTFEERPSGGIPNDIAALKGARLVMASEGEAGKRMAEAVLKRVTGRDLISARFMRKEFFEFKPTFLLFLATNNRPDFRGQDEGLWRRVRLIPWERYFEPHERDGRLGEQLLAERAGILAWAVRGAVAWFSGGLGDDRAGSVSAATTAYRESSDVLHGFLPGEYVADPDAPGVLATRLFQEFQEWADEHNMLDLKKWSSRAFYRALEERGIVRKRSTGGVFLIKGLRKSRSSDFTEEERAEAPPLAPSSDTNPAPLSGPSLDDVL
jgi:putative DNA primase/helicase